MITRRIFVLPILLLFLSASECFAAGEANHGENADQNKPAASVLTGVPVIVHSPVGTGNEKTPIETPPDPPEAPTCQVEDNETFGKVAGALSIQLFDPHVGSNTRLSAGADGLWLVHGELTSTQPDSFEGIACKFKLKKPNGNSMRILHPRENPVRLSETEVADDHLDLRPPWESMTCYSGGVGPEFQIKDFKKRKINAFRQQVFGDEMDVSLSLCKGANRRMRKQ